jgi:TonB family protein
MFANLVESGPKPRRSLAQALCSLAFHVAVGVGAVEASRRVVPAESPGPVVDTTIFILETRRPPPATAIRSAPPAGIAAPGPAPAPFDPPSIPAPHVVPAGIPPTDQGRLDPGRFVRAPAASCGSCDASPGDPATIYHEATVDTPAEILSRSRPSYPPSLRAAGLSGRVVLQFVVDTAGRVEPGSIDVLEGAHAAFESSAIEAVLDARFRPARVRGRPVRQLVRQGMTFRIE